MRTIGNKLYTWLMQLAVKIRPSRTGREAWDQLQPECEAAIERGIHPFMVIALAEWAVNKADYETTWPVDLFRSKVAKIYPEPPPTVWAHTDDYTIIANGDGDTTAFAVTRTSTPTHTGDQNYQDGKHTRTVE